MKTEHLAKLPLDMAISQLKKESTPNFDDHYPPSTGNDTCPTKAPDTVEDDWGDSCGGYQCWRKEGHPGQHMAGDGANGYVYWE